MSLISWKSCSGPCRRLMEVRRISMSTIKSHKPKILIRTQILWSKKLKIFWLYLITMLFRRRLQSRSRVQSIKLQTMFQRRHLDRTYRRMIQFQQLLSWGIQLTMSTIIIGWWNLEVNPLMICKAWIRMSERILLLLRQLSRRSHSNGMIPERAMAIVTKRTKKAKRPKKQAHANTNTTMKRLKKNVKR